MYVDFSGFSIYKILSVRRDVLLLPVQSGCLLLPFFLD